MFRDFIYMDIDRIQSIIAQLQEGLLNQVIEGKSEQTTGRAQMALNLLAMMLPISASGSVEHGRGTSFSESKVLHDYAFEAARRSLEERELLLEAEDLDWDEVPPTGFVLVRGAARILDYETLSKMAENIDKLDTFFSSPTTGSQKKKGRNKVIRESKVVLDTFYKDAIRVRITNSQGCGFIGPLTREHLRDDIRALIYKHGSRPKGEWTMLAEVTRVPLSDESLDEVLEHLDQDSGGGSVSGLLDQAIGALNLFQEFLGSVSYPDVAVSPVAVYREVAPLENS